MIGRWCCGVDVGRRANNNDPEAWRKILRILATGRCGPFIAAARRVRQQHAALDKGLVGVLDYHESG